MNLKNIFLVPEWHCAIRVSNEKSLIDERVCEFKVIKDNLRYWTADPFLYKKNNEYYLFFEAFDRLKRKGVIAYRKIDGDNAGKINIIYESRGHLSYPFIYEEQNQLYIMPESMEDNKIFRLKCVDFPDKWVLDKEIFNGNYVDTTLVNHNSKKYYISQKVVEKGVFERIDLLYDTPEGVAQCVNNPVKIDVSSARCAGEIFSYGDYLIRPSQDCGKFYGEKLNFNIIEELNDNSYSEKLLKSVTVSQIKTNDNKKYIGIHTYNRLDNLEVIDLKTAGSFNLFNYIGALLKRVRGLIVK